MKEEKELRCPRDCPGFNSLSICVKLKDCRYGEKEVENEQEAGISGDVCTRQSC